MIPGRMPVEVPTTATSGSRSELGKAMRLQPLKTLSSTEPPHARAAMKALGYRASEIQGDGPWRRRRRTRNQVRRMDACLALTYV
jgi:uncharacterized protein YjiS (DUF1127 family)